MPGNPPYWQNRPGNQAPRNASGNMHLIGNHRTFLKPGLRRRCGRPLIIHSYGRCYRYCHRQHGQRHRRYSSSNWESQRHPRIIWHNHHQGRQDGNLGQGKNRANHGQLQVQPTTLMTTSPLATPPLPSETVAVMMNSPVSEGAVHITLAPFPEIPPLSTDQA